MPPALRVPPRRGPAGLLVRGDNLDLLAALPAGAVDLVVTDPPFFTGRWRTAAGPVPSRPRTLPGGLPGFDDRWDGLDGYLGFLRPRLAAIHRALAPRGSAVLHLDHRAVHEVKAAMDLIFGRERFVNEIIWHYTGGGRSKRFFSRKHDTLLWYARSSRWTFHIDAVRQPYKPTSGYGRSGIVGRSGKRYLPHPDGTPVDDVWDIPMVNPLSLERCGFPTQKPERLLERIVLALSSPGDVVLDPFCGSGTTAVVAQRYGRRWIACDVLAAAVEVTEKRLLELAASGGNASAERTFRKIVLAPRAGTQELSWSR
jgi:site-specific DNA-methyltransferase (adenine-specific)